MNGENATTIFIVPFGVLVQDGKIMMSLRNDPENELAHNKWEFPGGQLEFGEKLEEGVLREVREETGYDVQIVCQLPHTYVESREFATGRFQFVLTPFVCTIAGGDGVSDDDEVLEMKLFDLDDVLDQDLLYNNADMFKAFRADLERIIKKIR